MKFTTIYKNGKPAYFFIKLDQEKEFELVRPYFLLTSMDHPRKGRILEMEVLFSGSVLYGRQRHGYGYSCSADVYGTLIQCIRELHGERLSDKARDELDSINTHNDALTVSAETLTELDSLNNDAIRAKYQA